LKNFIRQGKQAQATYGNAPSTDKSGGSAVDTDDHSLTTVTSRKEKYDVVSRQIVEEERKQQSRKPQYPGLDRFRLGEKMGDGAFSVVYKATEVQTGHDVAIKIIRKQDISASQVCFHCFYIPHLVLTEQRSSILKEVAIMRQLNHKNVVTLIDFFESPDHYFIVLELIPGGELFHQIVRLTYFSEDLSRHVIVQVAHAIRYLHEEAGVVHRDIKPENLLFYPSKFVPSKVKQVRKGEDESKEDEGEFIPGVGAGGIGVVKLADFGLSKIIWDSKTMTPCGTVGYTAPEIVRDERYSKSVDMWALGCVLYTILCGFPPFYDESIEALTQKVAKGQYTFLSPWWDEISKSAKDLVSHLLTVDPEQRYTIDQFLAHPWITQSNEPTEAAVDSPLAVVAERSTTPVGPPPTNLPTVPEEELLDAAVDSPRRAEMGYASPVIVTLKEVFDVSNAVHRMEEENARNRRRGGTVIMEEDETEENEDRLINGVQRGMDLMSMSSPPAKTRKKAINTSAGAAFFDLKLESATLLERRKRQQQSTGQQSPVTTTTQAPNPMLVPLTT
jgi:serine/threonine protein kinase